jgi:ribosomal protein S18 acetylase RimI-like enzyme
VHAIRRAGPADLDRLTPLFEAYRGFYRQAPDAERSRAFLAIRMAQGDSIILVADEGDRLAGFAQLYRCLSSLALAPMLVLNDLFVAPSARGRGTGAALLEASQSAARAAGVNKLTLSTSRTNDDAQRLYQSAGWALDIEFVTYRLDLSR